MNLNDHAKIVELDGNLEFTRNLALAQVRKAVGEKYGEDFLEVFRKERFGLSELRMYHTENEPDFQWYDETIQDVMTHAVRTGAIDQYSKYFVDKKASMPLELLVAASASLEMSDKPGSKAKAEFLNGYIDIRFIEIQDMFEPAETDFQEL
jgi:hypothetical protein